MTDTADLLLRDTRRNGMRDDARYDAQLKTYVMELRSAFSSRGGKIVEESDLLRVLHPAVNTLGYIWLLNHLIIDRTSDIYIISLAAFLNQFDPVQARYAGPEWRRIMDTTGELVHATRNPDLLTPLRNGLLRIDPAATTLLSLHLSYVELCLQTRRPREALPVLDKDLVNLPYDEISGVDERVLCSAAEGESYITVFSGISADLTAAMVQEYYLLGAQIYIGLRRYSRAILFLELILAHPGSSNPVSALMLEAYKKLILVSLVSKGAAPSIADMVDAPVSRTLIQLSKQYEALAEAFRARNVAKFAAEVDAAGSVWSDEGNAGLVGEVSDALRRYRVLDLQRHFAAMPVAKVAATLGMTAQSTVDLLQAMIAGGHVQASVEQQSLGEMVVRFRSWQAKAVTVGDAERKLKEQVKRIEALNEAVREADRRFSLTKEYNDWLRRNKRAGDAGAAAYEDPMEMDTEVGRVDDEDIMAG